MPGTDNVDAFLKRNNLSQDCWAKANISWEELQAIAQDHKGRAHELQESAELFARVIQSFEGVHSVRFRVKDPDHVLAKIVRKLGEGVSKYQSINRENYFDILTDLIGIRALHLFKVDSIGIHRQLMSSWRACEAPIVYVRSGENELLSKALPEEKFERKDHPDGYRSIHYVLESKPLRRVIKTEVQVRTLFEEGWSEVDHKLRYPRGAPHDVIAYCLLIFNRLAGSADEMADFVQELSRATAKLQEQVDAAASARESSVTAMEKLVAKLSDAEQQATERQATIEQLQSEMLKLKRASISESAVAPTASLYLAKLGEEMSVRPAFLDQFSKYGALASLADFGKEAEKADAPKK